MDESRRAIPKTQTSTLAAHTVVDEGQGTPSLHPDRGCPGGTRHAGRANNLRVTPVLLFATAALVAEDLAQGRTLAGSLLTLDRAVVNLQRFTGASLEEAMLMASHNPASMLGMPELTALAPGIPATLNRVDENSNLIAT